MKTLHLLPNVLHAEAKLDFQPPAIGALIAESEKGAHAYRKRFSLPQMPIHLLNEHTAHPDELLRIEQEEVGLISDAGMPCLADPGAQLVMAARKKGIAVKAYPGPSSILLALMLSGLSAQRFFFHGYLEREEKALMRQIQGFAPHVTHLFIEAPYRNLKLYETLLKALRPDDLLAIACNLTGPDEWVRTAAVKEWKEAPDIQKKPTIFLVAR